MGHAKISDIDGRVTELPEPPPGHAALWTGDAFNYLYVVAGATEYHLPTSVLYEQLGDELRTRLVSLAERCDRKDWVKMAAAITGGERMSMSTHICGVRNLDTGYFTKMIELQRACDAVKAKYPKELLAYFGDYVGESEDYLRREMEEVEIPKEAVKEIHRDASSGYEVRLDVLDPDIIAIRFENSW